MKKPRVWEDLDSNAQFEFVANLYELYNGDALKIAKHIRVTFGGNQSTIEQYCNRQRKSLERKLYGNELPRFNREKHVTLASIGNHKYVYDIRLRDLVDVK